MKHNQDNASNVYLAELEKWDEAQVGNYSRKVNAQFSFPWFKALLLLGIFGAFTGALWLANLFLTSFGISGGVFGIISSEICTLALAICFAGIAVLIAIFDAKKNTAKFVSDNNGEVGHSGGAYAKKLKIGTIASIVAVVVAYVLVFVLAFLFVTEADFRRFDLAKVMKALFTMDIFGSMLFVPSALVYTLVYYLSASAKLKSISADVCPVCGRSLYRIVKQVGELNINDESTGRVGYIYGQYKLDNAKGGAGGVATYCKYCSFFVKGNGTEKLD